MKYIKSDQEKSTIVFICNEITLIDQIIEKSLFLIKEGKFNGNISIGLDELREISTFLKLEQEEMYPGLRLDLDLRQLSILVEITAEAIYSNQEAYIELDPYRKDMKSINIFIRKVVDNMLKDELSVKVVKEAIGIGKQAQIEAKKRGKNLSKDQIREECILKLENFNLAFLLFDHEKYSRKAWAGIQLAFLDDDRNLITKSPMKIIDIIDIKSIVAYFTKSIQILSHKDKAIDFDEYFLSIDSRRNDSLLDIDIRSGEIQDEEGYLLIDLSLKVKDNEKSLGAKKDRFHVDSKVDIEDVYIFLNSIKNYLIEAYRRELAEA